MLGTRQITQTAAQWTANIRLTIPRLGVRVPANHSKAASPQASFDGLGGHHYPPAPSGWLGVSSVATGLPFF